MSVLATFEISLSMHAVLFSTICAPCYFHVILVLSCAVLLNVSQGQALGFPFYVFLVLSSYQWRVVGGIPGKIPELNLEKFKNLCLLSWSLYFIHLRRMAENIST